VTLLLPVASAVVVAFLWPTPAFACGGACSSDALGALSVLAVVAVAIAAVSRAVSFIRLRRLSRALEESAR
jgi:hypothetical protein